MVDSEEEIIIEIVEYFKKLYSKKKKERGFEGLEWSPIGPESKNWLERPFEEREIRSVIEECEGDKAPRPDRFTIEFFKRGLDFIKEDILGVFNEFYQNGIVNACTNSTYICLIPKKLSSLKLKD